ncbi:hypothetical protein [Marinifilum sp.]|uniref:hypothetical protein n=1 Tax=Marinifilum sp. TaxID=2033137 RepID=UPI003BA86EB0
MKIACILLLLCFGIDSHAQLAESESKLKSNFDALIEAEQDSVKLAICKRIEKSLVKILKQEESFEYPFAKLNYLGKITSPDLRFRIYNWNCALSDGSYKYFGVFQFKEKSNIKVQVLADKVEANMFSSYRKENWPGALYYKIIPFKSKGMASYILLAWDGNNMTSNKKIIEVICFDKTGIVFGKPVIFWRGKMLNRVIFEYAKQARMSIEYQEEEKRLVFDHLAPSSPQYKNQFEYYGPDFTHDALVLKKGIWVLQENVDVRKK